MEFSVAPNQLKLFAYILTLFKDFCYAYIESCASRFTLTDEHEGDDGKGVTLKLNFDLDIPPETVRHLERIRSEGDEVWKRYLKSCILKSVDECKRNDFKVHRNRR